MSGVDLVLWDLIRKVLGQPVYRLLGGRTKEKIPCDVTIHPDQIDSWNDGGFIGVKIAARCGVADGRTGLKKMRACLETCRKAIGDFMELLSIG